MYPRNPPKNKNDEAAKKILRSKTWRIVLLSWAVILALISIPILCALLADWRGASTAVEPEHPLPSSSPLPEITSTVPPITRTTAGHTPKQPRPSPTVGFTPSVEPSITNQPWQWCDIDLFDIKVEIPSNWTIHEINRRSPSVSDFVDHDCADYLLVGQENGEYILLKFICYASDAVPWDCPNGIIWFGESAARALNQENNTYSYTNVIMGYASNGNPVCASPLLWVTGENWIIVEYGREATGNEVQIDFAIPDRIVLSLQRK